MVTSRLIQSRTALGTLLVLAPGSAFANFFWPPALYYYGATVWWAVPGGLVAEYLVLLPFLRKSTKDLLAIVLVSNAASAAIGFLATWPLVFWDKGVGVLAQAGFAAVVSVAVVIFIVNVAIEYVVAVKWLHVSRQGFALLGFVIANAISFAILAAAGISNLR